MSKNTHTHTHKKKKEDTQTHTHIYYNMVSSLYPNEQAISLYIKLLTVIFYVFIDDNRLLHTLVTRCCVILYFIFGSMRPDS